MAHMRQIKQHKDGIKINGERAKTDQHIHIRQTAFNATPSAFIEGNRQAELHNRG